MKKKLLSLGSAVVVGASLVGAPSAYAVDKEDAVLETWGDHEVTVTPGGQVHVPLAVEWVPDIVFRGINVENNPKCNWLKYGPFAWNGQAPAASENEAENTYDCKVKTLFTTRDGSKVGEHEVIVHVGEYQVGEPTFTEDSYEFGEPVFVQDEPEQPAAAEPTGSSVNKGALFGILAGLGAVGTLIATLIHNNGLVDSVVQKANELLAPLSTSLNELLPANFRK